MNAPVNFFTNLLNIKHMVLVCIKNNIGLAFDFIKKAAP